MNILVIENKINLVNRLNKSLRSHGYNPYIVTKISDAVIAINANEKIFFLIIIDLDKSIINKKIIDFCKYVRISRNLTPILFFSDEIDITKRIEILENGATDYIVRPFSIADLMEKIESLLNVESINIQVENKIKLNKRDNFIEVSDKKIELTDREASILRFLMSREGETLSREVIFENVWTLDSNLNSNVVDVHIKNLRKKIQDTINTNLIDTIWGEGYNFSSK